MARLSRESRTPTIVDAQQFALAISVEIAALRAAGVDPAAVDALEERSTAVAQIVDKFNRMVAAARASGQYTVQGLFSRIDTLATAARADVEKLVAAVTYQNRIDEIETKIAATPIRPPRLTKEVTATGEVLLLGPPPASRQEPDLRGELREQEIRQRLEGQDRLLTEAEFRTAISAGNALIFAALADDPLRGTAFALISSAVREEGLKAWAEKHSPQLVAELEGLRRLASVWESALAMAESCIMAAGGSVAHDPLKEAAA